MKIKPRPRTVSIVAIPFLATGLAACSGSSTGSSTPPPKAGSTVTMDLSGPLTSYDPAKGSSFQDAVAMWSLYDPLVDFDPSGKIVAGLADSWSTTTSSATLKLRSGVSCSDGTKLTAQMVAKSLTRYMNPKTAAPFLNLVIGSHNTAKVTAPGPDTVKITLQKPWSGLLAGLTTPYTGIICPAGLKDPANLLTKSYGTGPYVSSKQVSGASYTMTRRTGYTWGPKFAGAPTGGKAPKTLVLKVIQDESTKSNLMSTGQLQIGTYGSNAWKRFKGQSGQTVVSEPQSDTWLMFNENKGHPTANPAIRKAISQALNRNMINSVQSYGAGKLISNLGEPSYQCYDNSLDALIPASDPAAAAAALKGVNVRIIGTNLLAAGDANSYLLSALQAAGAKASLNTMNNETWVGDLFSGKNDWDISIMVLGNTISSFLEAGGFETGAAPPAGQNIGNVQNPAAEAAFTQAGVTDGAAKCAALSKFQKALITNNDVLPIATSPVHTVFAGSTSGVVVKGFVQPGTIRLNK